MIDSVPTVLPEATIADIERLLINRSTEFETISYIYVLDKQKKLIGILSIKDVFRSDKAKKAGQFKIGKLVSASLASRPQDIALMALKHNLKSIPIVDRQGVFLGVVSHHQILKIIDSHAIEKILRLGGLVRVSGYDQILKIPIWVSLKHRLPWLTLGLLGGLLTAGIVNRFEQIISRNIILAAFIPLVVYMADAVGTQMEAFIIRDLAIEPKLRLPHYLLRQMTIVSILGLSLSLALYGISWLIYDRPEISFVIALAMFLAIVSSILSGLIVPFLFNKLKFDPANASGPIATIIQDVLSIVVYLAIAGAFL